MVAKPIYQYTPAAVADAIQRAGGSIAGAARLLGMPRQTLQSMRDRFAREATSPAVAPPAREPEADRLRAQVRAMAKELGVVGLMNTQFAIQGDDIHVLAGRRERAPEPAVGVGRLLRLGQPRPR